MDTSLCERPITTPNRCSLCPSEGMVVSRPELMSPGHPPGSGSAALGHALLSHSQILQPHCRPPLVRGLPLPHARNQCLLESQELEAFAGGRASRAVTEVLFSVPMWGPSPPAEMPYAFSNQEDKQQCAEGFISSVSFIHEGGATVTPILQMRKQTQRVSEHLQELATNHGHRLGRGILKAETIFGFVPSLPASKTVFSPGCFTTTVLSKTGPVFCIKATMFPAISSPQTLNLR